MNILTFDTKFQKSLDVNAPAMAAHGRILPLDQAWGPLPTDAHAVAYLPSRGDSYPRLGKTSQDWAMAQGIQLHWLMFDIDNPSHQPWESEELAQSALNGALDILPLAFRDFAGGYTTRAGYRICLHLGKPVELDVAGHLLEYIGEVLLAEVGIIVDAQCYQWNRLFRMPQVVRDGKAMTAFCEEPETFPHDIHQALGLTPEAKSVAAPIDGECPTKPMDIPDYIWRRNILFPEVTRGDALFASDGDGSIFRAARSAMAHIASQASIVDPTVLISCLWNSLLASGREPDEFWRFACWVCAQEAEKVATVEEKPTWSLAAPESSTLPKVSESWKKAAKAAAARAGKDYLVECYRLLAKGYPISVPRVTPFQALQKLIIGSFAPTPLAEDPRTVYAFCLASFRETTAVRLEKEQDLWEVCLEAAEIAWAARMEKQKGVDAIKEVDELRSSWPLLLTNGQHYFALDARCGNGEYTYLNVGAEQAVVTMRLMQRNLPIDLDNVTLGPKGGLNTASAVLDKVGGMVDSVAYRSGLTSARFTNNRRNLELPCHRLADVKPEYNAQVEKWMQLLAGDQYRRLCRWVAVAHKTADNPVACLYLQGNPGCGKSLFFHALEGRWEGPRGDYNQITNATHQTGLLQSPLLVADEGVNIKKFSGGPSSASATFRSLTANFSHTVEEKYKSPAQVNAYFRVGVTANNSDGLPFRETLGKAGIDAIVERVVWIGVAQAAGDYLRELFADPAVKKAWVHGGAITRHFVWLAESLDVEPDGRFLVSGEVTDWHRKFVRNQGIKPEVSLVLASIAKDLMQGPRRFLRGAYATPDGIHVLHRKVMETWQDMSPPRHTVLTRALDSLADDVTRRSDDGQRPGNRCFYRVPWQTVFDSGELDDTTRDKINNPKTWTSK